MMKAFKVVWDNAGYSAGDIIDCFNEAQRRLGVKELWVSSDTTDTGYFTPDPPVKGVPFVTTDGETVILGRPFIEGPYETAKEWLTHTIVPMMEGMEEEFAEAFAKEDN